jgi:hypothetical protein
VAETRANQHGNDNPGGERWTKAGVNDERGSVIQRIVKRSVRQRRDVVADDRENRRNL